jgi:hypothetical protein
MNFTQSPIPDYLQHYQTTEYEQAVPDALSENDSSLDALLNSKKDLIVDKLHMLGNAIEHRRKISQDLQFSIDTDISKCQQQIFDLEHTTYFALQRDWELKKFDLEKEKRQELTSYFRDLTMIEKEIRESKLELFKEKQTEAFFQ